jgi:hypothetical protein
MSLATLFNPPPRTPQALSEFTFSNMADHLDISAAIQRQKNITIVNLALDPLDPNALEVWLIAHQAMHVQQTGALNIAGQDFSTLSLTNPEESAEWFFEHGSEHRAMHAALGI